MYTCATRDFLINRFIADDGNANTCVEYFFRAASVHRNSHRTQYFRKYRLDLTEVSQFEIVFIYIETVQWSILTSGETKRAISWLNELTLLDFYNFIIIR